MQCHTPYKPAYTATLHPFTALYYTTTLTTTHNYTHHHNTIIHFSPLILHVFTTTLHSSTVLPAYLFFFYHIAYTVTCAFHKSALFSIVGLAYMLLLFSTKSGYATSVTPPFYQYKLSIVFIHRKLHVITNKGHDVRKAIVARMGDREGNEGGMTDRGKEGDGEYEERDKGEGTVGKGKRESKRDGTKWRNEVEGSEGETGQERGTIFKLIPRNLVTSVVMLML